MYYPTANTLSNSQHTIQSLWRGSHDLSAWRARRTKSRARSQGPEGPLTSSLLYLVTLKIPQEIALFGISSSRKCHLMSLIMLSIFSTPGASLAKIRALLKNYAQRFCLFLQVFWKMSQLIEILKIVFYYYVNSCKLNTRYSRLL